MALIKDFLINRNFRFVLLLPYDMSIINSVGYCDTQYKEKRPVREGFHFPLNNNNMSDN